MHRCIARLSEQPRHHSVRCLSFPVRKRRALRSAFPVLQQHFVPIQQHVYEANLQNSNSCSKRYAELSEKVRKGGGESSIIRHTQKNRKLLVRDRLRLLLDDEDFLELSPFAGLGLPYGDIASAGCLTGVGRINGLWCVVIANDATVKGGTAYPITVKKQLRAQEVAIQNRLPYKNQGGRTFYNEAIMSAMKIPQVSVVCGSCTAGGAYIPTMAEETVMVHRIGTLFLGGPPLVKAATGEEVTPEDLGGATLHAKVSGCVDHFASEEKDAYDCTRNIISTLNFQLPEEEEEPARRRAEEEPLYSSEELLGLAPRSYNYSLDVKMLLHEAALKGSHFVQLCDQRDVPLIFLQNTAPAAAPTLATTQAETNSNCLKAQGSMMSAVACASVPKITVVIGGCHGADSYAMCGRAFDPNFLFMWPNARVSITAPDHASSLLPHDSNQVEDVNRMLTEESSAFFSSGRLWDDGIILPQHTRKVLADCLDIITQQQYQMSTEKAHSSLLRI
ncbi:hypothetical protein fugu_006344 [Takifugu bimaculatus]|uniref:methylcrotonoyl-CoA carboxylase n=1 Tax=Takifugu bimaculatus TaxID=433685 RepID=A0A4Z2B6Z6_9TELE|nr:hypothetical protein fugu_006344 [Takifugu bimaculatus]